MIVIGLCMYVCIGEGFNTRLHRVNAIDCKELIL